MLELAAVIVPSLAAGNLVGHGAARRFVGIDRDLAFASGNGDRRDLARKTARRNSLLRAAQRLKREFVHLFAGELVFVGSDLRELSHRLARIVCVFEPVEEHVVIGGVVARASARAMFLEQVRRVGHGLHSARHDNIHRAARQRFRAHDRGLHARAANLVDRRCLCAERQTGTERSLPRGILAEACRKHAAHVDPIHRVAVDSRALHCGFHCHRAKFGRTCTGERTVEIADGRACAGCDHDGVVRGKSRHVRNSLPEAVAPHPGSGIMLRCNRSKRLLRWGIAPAPLAP